MCSMIPHKQNKQNPLSFQMIFTNQQCSAALTANHQNQESWGKNKGNQQGGNPESKIYCLCNKRRFATSLIPWKRKPPSINYSVLLCYNARCTLNKSWTIRRSTYARQLKVNMLLETVWLKKHMWKKHFLSLRDWGTVYLFWSWSYGKVLLFPMP